MGKFIVYSCSKVSSEDTGQDYNGDVVILSCVSDPSLMLFFPITEINANLLSFVLDDNSDFDIDTSTIGIYQTMLNSWRASDRYLSGIIMDIVYNPEMNDYVMDVKLAVSDKMGALDSVVRVNFVHAILLSVMEELGIIVTDELLTRLAPDAEEYDEESGILEKKSPDRFPKDKNILKIVRDIMGAEERPTTNKTTTLRPPRKNTKSKPEDTKE